MSESHSTLHGFGKALEKWKSFTLLKKKDAQAIEVKYINSKSRRKLVAFGGFSSQPKDELSLLILWK